eukprot:scaffold5.g732.t1
MPLTEVSIMLMAEADRRAAGIASPLRPTVSPAQVAWDQAVAPRRARPSCGAAAPLTPCSAPPATPSRAQFVDSLEDVGRHLQRSVKELPSTQARGQGWPRLVLHSSAINRLVRGEGGRLRLQSKNPVVLILGSGWGAHSIIKVIDTDQLRVNSWLFYSKPSTEQFDVICVSPTNHFLFTPMLPSTAVGTIEFRSLTEAIREANPFVDYYEARGAPQISESYPMLVVIFDIHALQARSACARAFGREATGEGSGDYERATCNSVDVKAKVPYDVLVVAIGEKPATFGVPGVEKHCFFMKQVSLFNSGQAILMTFDSTLQQRALENFKRTGVEVRLGMQVTEVKQDVIVVGSGEEREEIPYGVCVWSAGNAPWPLITQIANQIPEQAELSPGRPCSKLSVDPFLRVIGARDIISLGDCSRVVAAQQGAYAAHLVNRGYRLGRGGITELPPRKPVSKLSLSDRLHRLADLDVLLQARVASNDLDEEEEEEEEEEVVVYCKKPFNFLSLGIMAYVGNERALTQIDMGDASLKLSGQFAFLVWKSVPQRTAPMPPPPCPLCSNSYITKQVSFRNRVLILFDWLKTRVFGRDTTSF